MVYKWKPGTFLVADAAKVGTELERLGQVVSAESVVEAARDDETELHKCFEWDDSEAARQHRLSQARYVLRRISVVHEVTRPDAEPVCVRVRAYECVQITANERRYVPTTTALSSPDLRVQVLGRLERTIAEAEQTARIYAYLCDEIRDVQPMLSEAWQTVRRALVPV